MWKIVSTDEELRTFLDFVSCFHDSCIKEMHYTSGAYVDEDYSMYPVNDYRILRVIVQHQDEQSSVIEMEFAGLKSLQLTPFDERYTCEIHDSTMVLKDGCVYWCDGSKMTDADPADGSIYICASHLRWRTLNSPSCLGSRPIYKSTVET